MSKSQMLINYVPGEECRVAIVEDGKLEELYVEQSARASRVGNIYVGKVVNVEAAIQAAFIDFGVGDNGFLHVTDLHPRYFPGEEEDTTERVGFKTPRRERPPIQHCLRRGQEVIVQVLKEGVGTKGPTVTSYLSIPGRFLVMMPWMDRVGVSRKVEDEDQRRKMREILDQLDLPDGFGFILRTAGFSRTKAELKRDLAYLLRLWKDMDKRLKVGGKARLLYSESDLLVRALRDVLTGDTGEVVIDHESAVQRAARFMKIVSPRTTTRLLHYNQPAPIFHAFGIEQQISLIHAREVPLPSGGRLVIDQTEALVAIDVNSGRSRESRDSETNAYQTNIEAVDEICRQLRLRDMGGIVINDLIDMRDSKHRKDIEHRVKERLKRDRAKTTISSISEFGILEMTRQRMRPSHESVHFTDCPICRGRGMLQRPDSVASDALRELAAILSVERVHKVELVVAPRVAGELLSSKRAMLSRTEHRYAKHVDVRVSEAVPVDRVSFYAYDAEGQDIDVNNLPSPPRPRDIPEVQIEIPRAEEEWSDEQVTPSPDLVETPEDVQPHPIEDDLTDEAAEETIRAGATTGPVPQGEGSGRKRRRRRRGRGGRGEGEVQGGASPGAQQPQPAQAPMPPDEPASPVETPEGDGQQPGEGGGRRRRRRRRRGGRGRSGGPENMQGAQVQGSAPPQAAGPAFREGTPETGGDWGDASGESKAPARPVEVGAPEADEMDSELESPETPGESRALGPDAGQGQEGGGRRRRRRRRGRGRGRAGGGDGQQPGGSAQAANQNQPNPNGNSHERRREQPPPAPAAPTPSERKPQVRSLYGTVRRKLSASELNKRPKPE